MPTLMSVRATQLWLGLAYAGLCVLALARDRDLLTSLLSLALALATFFTGKTLPDERIPTAMLPRAVGVGAVVLLCGAWAVSFGGPKTYTWAAIALAACAGNRLRAAGLGEATGG